VRVGFGDCMDTIWEAMVVAEGGEEEEMEIGGDAEASLGSGGFRETAELS
ncbi:hypothetical protein KI387_017306, partial [Taxus chinensis]